MRLQKSYEVANFKALPGEAGEFEAIVSVFGNVDLQGDRVVPGAYSKTLDEWRAAGDPIPVIWSHDWADPFAHIGYVDPAQAHEVPPGTMAGAAAAGGLLVRGRLDVQKPFAKQVYDLMRQRRIKEFSFSYDIVTERKAADGANELVELKLIEVGPTLKGANPETISMSVKADMQESRRKLENAALEQRVKAKTLTDAMEIDPEIARVLHDSHLTEPQAPAVEVEPAKRFRIEERVVFTGAKYDLESAPMFVCVGPDGECGHYHTSKSLAEDHVQEITSEEPAPPAADPAPPTTPEGAQPDGVKEEGKPWHIEEHDGKFCVIKDDGGENEGCHDTREEAEAQVRALYASEQAADGDAKSGNITFTVTGSEVIPSNSSNGFTVSNIAGPGEKAGRVIGSKRVSDLKAAIDVAVDSWAQQVNGDAEEASTPDSDGAKHELAELNARLDSLA